MKFNVRNINAEEAERKRICQEQLAQDRQKLLMQWPFIGGVIMRMELVAVRDDRLSTACTDGNNIFVDINFYSGLNMHERLFVLAHEVWHSVMLHFARKKNRNEKLFNIAADLEIHFTLQNEKMKEPWVLPHDPNWANLSAEEIYEKLLVDKRYKSLSVPAKSEDSDNSEGSDSQDGSAQQNENTDKSNDPAAESFDKHIYDDNASEISSMPSKQNKDEKQDDDRTDGESGSDGNNGTQTAPGAGGDADKNGNGSGNNSDFVVDDDFAPSVSDDTAERVRGRVVSAAVHVERLCGTLPGNIKKLLKDFLTPNIPWQELLKQFVTSCYGGKRRWLPPSRRHVWHDLYLPSMRTEQLKAVVAMDTSGSTMNDLDQFFTELVSLMKTFGRYEITLIQCDSEIQKVEKFSDTVRWKNFSAAGMGGTDFRPVFKYVSDTMTEPPELLIYLTDGYGPAPELPPRYPVLWLITKDGTKPCSWGKSVFFNS